MNEVISSMNGGLWIFALVLIAMVVVQAVLFLRLALNFNKKNNLISKDELKSAIRTGTVSVIGPSISAMVIALSLIAMVGSAVTFMRCGVIGAPAWELFMANLSAGTVGVQFNTPEFTKEVFVLCIFGMTFASAPYFINTIITLGPLDRIVKKSQEAQTKEKKESFLPTLGSAAMMGIVGYSIVDYLKTPQQIAAVVTAMVVSFALVNYVNKSGKKWINDWNMAIAMVLGMAVGQIVLTILS